MYKKYQDCGDLEETLMAACDFMERAYEQAPVVEMCIRDRGTDDRSKLLCALLPSQRGHRGQGQASLYPSSAAAWAQGTGSSFSVPFSRLNVNSLWVCEACFASDTHAVDSWRVCEAYSIADTQIVKTEGITRKLYIP